MRPCGGSNPDCEVPFGVLDQPVWENRDAPNKNHFRSGDLVPLIEGHHSSVYRVGLEVSDPRYKLMPI